MKDNQAAVPDPGEPAVAGPPDAVVNAPGFRGSGRGSNRLTRILSGVFGLVVLVLGVGASGAWYLQQRIESVDRLSGAFPTEPGRPAESDELRVLVLGQDWGTETADHGRSDAIMLLDVARDRSSVSAISFPRDAWVDIPGHGKGKINSTLPIGGPSLAVETVEDLTGIRIDHVATIDGNGFPALTDAIGGVVVEIPETVHDDARDITWIAGEHHLNGEQALDYVGQRYGLPNGDLDRVRRHQNFIRALVATTIAESTWTDPGKLFQVSVAAADALEIDDQWSAGEIRDLAISVRKLDMSDLSFATVPVSGLDNVQGQSVVRLDELAGQELWQAMREGRTRDWIQEAHADLPGSIP